ncbi:uncharacterized protein [Typha latifolia]|uniref:uncharacterized protein n=1 Tax=Typha latifolia TaxID=4733 RepID=UPI003C2DF86F
MGTLRFGDRFCVPDVGELRKKILEEARHTSYNVHPGETKMYHDVRRSFLVARIEEVHSKVFNTADSMEQRASLFRDEIFARHEAPISITSNRDPRFTSRLWQQFARSLVADFGLSWDRHLPLIEFAYNNSYHSSIRIPPYEALYGRRYWTPISWNEVGERKIDSSKLIQETIDKV